MLQLVVETFCRCEWHRPWLLLSYLYQSASWTPAGMVYLCSCESQVCCHSLVMGIISALEEKCSRCPNRGTIRNWDSIFFQSLICSVAPVLELQLSTPWHRGWTKGCFWKPFHSTWLRGHKRTWHMSVPGTRSKSLLPFWGQHTYQKSTLECWLGSTKTINSSAEWLTVREH